MFNYLKIYFTTENKQQTIMTEFVVMYSFKALKLAAYKKKLYNKKKIIQK